MWRRRQRPSIVASGVLWYVAVVLTLLLATGYAAAALRITWDSEDDPNNLHRGRWWNYYARGCARLEKGRYQEALADFARAAAKRSEDAYDARTYGMHFTDYFPHRESGIACYLDGLRRTGKNDRIRLFRQAEAELKKSLEQQDSSRAKFYLNHTRRELVKLTGDDSTPPVVYVNRPIYTRQRTVRFDVIAMDAQSYVAEIQIEDPRGTLQIDRPKLFVEDAQDKVKAEAEVTIRPPQVMAVAEITASDLVGNRSKPSRALIVLDTGAPQALVTIDAAAPRKNGRVPATVNAADDYALKCIQVGENPDDRFDCDGAGSYSGRIDGVPKDDVLLVRVVDVAGNESVSPVPIKEAPRTGALAQSSWLQTPRRFPVENGGGRPDQDQQLRTTFSPSVLAYLRDSSPFGSQAAPAWLAALIPASSGDDDQEMDQHLPVFDFSPPISPDPCGLTVTTQDCLPVDGTLQNAKSVTKITVEGPSVGTSTCERIAERGSGYLAFGHNVNLARVPVGGREELTIRAWRGGQECAREVRWVERRTPSQLDPTGVYQIMFLLPVPQSGTNRLSVSADFRGDVYESVVESLKRLRLQERVSRFGIQEVGSKYGEPSRVGCGRDVDDVLADLNKKGSDKAAEPDVTDLVIYGDLTVHNVDGEERFEIVLRARDVCKPELGDLSFRGRSAAEESHVLADVYGRTKDLKWWSDFLAFKVGQRFPRVQAQAPVKTPSWPARVIGRKASIQVNYGVKDGLFENMKVWFYAPRQGPSNDCLRRICPGRITRLDSDSSQMCPEDDRAPLRGDVMVITK